MPWKYLADATELTRYFPLGRLKQLAADTVAQATAGLADPTVAANIGFANEAGEGEIDAMLSTRFDVDSLTVTPRLKLCAAVLTTYYLMERKSEISDLWTKKYQREIEWLTKVTERELGIGAEAQPENETILTTADDSTAAGAGLVFGAGGLDDLV